MTTVYVSIGNSDDKLSQREWADFISDTADTIAPAAEQIHGAWFSAPDQPWQNMSICFEIGEASVDGLKGSLEQLAADYRQDSIAWAVVAETEFIGPPKVSAEPLIDPDCRAGKHAPTCVGDPCACDCHETGLEALSADAVSEGE